MGVRAFSRFAAFGNVVLELGSYTTLGEAISLAEMELGVRIELDTSPLTTEPQTKGSGHPKGDSQAEGQASEETAIARSRRRQKLLRRATTCCVPGTATYLDGHECNIIYCRALVTEDAPINITSFQAKHSSFPTHSTLRQLFDDETFEAYRALGYHCASKIGRQPPWLDAARGLIPASGAPANGPNEPATLQRTRDASGISVRIQ